jgi:peptidoglycan/LPS O-acetylase OafA/YrhL
LIFVLGASTYIGLSWRGYDLAYRWGFDITSIGFIFLAVQWCCHQLAKRYESHASHLSLIRVPTRFLAASGKNSYQLYLIHQPLLIVVLPVLYQGLTRVRGLSPFAILAGSAVISFGLLILEVWVFGICDRLLAKVIRRRLSPV